ncbi:ABC transporter ATP-binding protein [Fibrobacter sp.]|jgi:sulfonate transport system ATP-binding protein|uniref:ABC transporter ATP-binding protein n=1 Tax=Fibrobacter sp. TaxID=35828 RepID=UPI00386814FE
MVTEKKENLKGAIRIENLVKTFISNEGETVTALNGVNLDIPPGSFVSLIGPSGCGKTTLLRQIAGLATPTSGGVFVDGKKVTKPGADRGFAFQQATLFPWLNIRDNIALGLKARHVYKEHKQDVDEFIETVGLKGFEKSYPHELSGGMNQRASLARALVGHPDILLLDEPLGALDAFTRMAMQDEIHRLWEKYKTTMVMVTHDVDEALYLSDYVVVMKARPSKIEQVIHIDLPFPRIRTQDTFILYRKKILEILNFAGKIPEPEYYL